MERHEITELLNQLTENEPAAEDRLFAAVYEELRTIARSQMRRERRDHTLQPTALVHEAYIKLLGTKTVPWQNRAHFFGVAARAMRQVLIDHARKRAAEKRGGAARKVTLADTLSDGGGPELEVIALNEALERFSELDGRAARVVEMRVFTGLKMEEIGQILGVSRRTVYDDWDVAKRWFEREFFRAGG